jgi:hypothetical protein
MEVLKQSVKYLANEELKRANKIYPLFHSQHEGYAVIKEEIEETQSELIRIGFILDSMWKDIKLNSSVDIMRSYANQIRGQAILVASEAIQVAAMAQKFKDSIKGE